MITISREQASCNWFRRGIDFPEEHPCQGCKRGKCYLDRDRSPWPLWVLDLRDWWNGKSEEK